MRGQKILRLPSVCVVEVDKDYSVTSLELRLAGINIARYEQLPAGVDIKPEILERLNIIETGVFRYKTLAKILKNVETEFVGRFKRLRFAREIGVAYYRNNPIIYEMLIDEETQRVKYVIIVAMPGSGIAREIASRLREARLNVIFVLETRKPLRSRRISL